MLTADSQLANSSTPEEVILLGPLGAENTSATPVVLGSPGCTIQFLGNNVFQGIAPRLESRLGMSHRQ